MAQGNFTYEQVMKDKMIKAKAADEADLDKSFAPILVLEIRPESESSKPESDEGEDEGCGPKMVKAMCPSCKMTGMMEVVEE